MIGYRPIALGLAYCLFCTATAFAENFTGKVVGITDGDTITLLHNGRSEKIRLNGIDCPENGQAFGKRAKRAASQLVFGQQKMAMNSAARSTVRHQTL